MSEYKVGQTYDLGASGLKKLLKRDHCTSQGYDKDENVKSCKECRGFLVFEIQEKDYHVCGYSDDGQRHFNST